MVYTVGRSWPMCITLHWSVLKASSHCFDHSINIFRSCCIKSLSLVSLKETSNVSDVRVPGRPYPRMNPIHKLLKKLHSHKAAGPDGIRNHLWKIAADEVSSVPWQILQASVHRGLVPRDWRKAHIIPVFKKGDWAKLFAVKLWNTWCTATSWNISNTITFWPISNTISLKAGLMSHSW